MFFGSLALSVVHLENQNLFWIWNLTWLHDSSMILAWVSFCKNIFATLPLKPSVARSWVRLEYFSGWDLHQLWHMTSDVWHLPIVTYAYIVPVVTVTCDTCASCDSCDMWKLCRPGAPWIIFFRISSLTGYRLRIGDKCEKWWLVFVHIYSFSVGERSCYLQELAMSWQCTLHMTIIFQLTIVTCDMGRHSWWQETSDKWQVTSDKWQVTRTCAWQVISAAPPTGAWTSPLGSTPVMWGESVNIISGDEIHLCLVITNYKKIL